MKESLMYGMGNRCNDGRYVLFLDYDDVPVQWVIDEINLLHEVACGSVGNAYLFRTKHGLHVVFLEKHSLGDVVELLNMTSCDKQYKAIPMRYARRIWVLRQSPKKNETMEYLGVITKDCNLDRSMAHREWLQSYYRIPDKDFPVTGWDDEEKIIIGYYHVNDE